MSVSELMESFTFKSRVVPSHEMEIFLHLKTLQKYSLSEDVSEKKCDIDRAQFDKFTFDLKLFQGHLQFF